MPEVSCWAAPALCHFMQVLRMPARSMLWAGLVASIVAAAALAPAAEIAKEAATRDDAARDAAMDDDERDSLRRLQRHKIGRRRELELRCPPNKRPRAPHALLVPPITRDPCSLLRQCLGFDSYVHMNA